MRGPASGRTLLEAFIPVYHFREVHYTLVRAAPEHIAAVVKSVTAEEVPFFRALMGLRTLPARFRGSRGFRVTTGRPLLEQFLGAGFVLLAEVPPRELVVGRVGQFWKVFNWRIPGPSLGGGVSRV